MQEFESLDSYLSRQVTDHDLLPEVARTILKITEATQQISALVRRGPLAGSMGAERGDNSDGDVQKELDIVANNRIIETLQDSPVVWLASEELDEPLQINPGAPLIVAIDPLDGSSNIETNTAVGTIFSILPAGDPVDPTADAAVLQPGTNQLAAAYVIYGPQTALVLTTGRGTNIFTLDPEAAEFRLTTADVRIAESTREFAINVSNFRHWDRHIRTYIDDCMEGEDGFRDSNYNMRWLASLVAESHRIFSRGGVFLYPSDARQGYASGRLRLLYEVNPIAFLVEQAGGYATTGRQRVMEIQPKNIHQRVPMIFGSRREIRRVERYHDDSGMTGERSQLFSKRGLFRT
jgi:fructose-1,6-bisphosphatase I